MLEAEQPTSDKVKILEFKGTGSMYIRIQRWEAPRMMCISYYNPAVKHIVNEVGNYDQYSDMLAKIENVIDRKIQRIG